MKNERICTSPQTNLAVRIIRLITQRRITYKRYHAKVRCGKEGAGVKKGRKGKKDRQRKKSSERKEGQACEPPCFSGHLMQSTCTPT